MTAQLKDFTPLILNNRTTDLVPFKYYNWYADSKNKDLIRNVLVFTLSVLAHIAILLVVVKMPQLSEPILQKPEQPIMVSLLENRPIAPKLAQVRDELNKPFPEQKHLLTPPEKPIVSANTLQNNPQTIQVPITQTLANQTMPTQSSASEAKVTQETTPVAVQHTAASDNQAATKPATEATETKVKETEPKEDVLEPPRFGVAYLNNPKPNYPNLSRRMREQGRVLFKVLVGVNGESESVEIAKTSGFERLDQAGLEAVKQWRFVPAKKNNQVISAYVVVPISFSLD